ncbi:uncharacterized protein ARMOST_14452 [Armillaria ostoyae]|uniref:Uncharacterized protein n=1 Tax=Armillaria ostoyae TaxID=47428 RepID=A0A284RQM1_ARMOS|nr:uncharacterized protein ARMOST_14452 [Armillaria ostoyae]
MVNLTNVNLSPLTVSYINDFVVGVNDVLVAQRRRFALHVLAFSALLSCPLFEQDSLPFTSRLLEADVSDTDDRWLFTLYPWYYDPLYFPEVHPESCIPSFPLHLIPLFQMLQQNTGLIVSWIESFRFSLANDFPWIRYRPLC